MKKRNIYLLSALLLMMSGNVQAGFFMNWFVNKPLVVIGYIVDYVIPESKQGVKRIRTENSAFTLKVAAEVADAMEQRAEHLGARLDDNEKQLKGLSGAFISYGKQQKIAHAEMLRIAAENEFNVEQAKQKFLEKDAVSQANITNSIRALEDKQSALEEEIKKVEDDELKTGALQLKFVHGQLRAKMIHARLKKLRQEHEKINQTLASLAEQLANCQKKGEQFEERVNHLHKTQTEIQKEYYQQMQTLHNKTREYASFFIGIANLINNDITPSVQELKEDVKVIRDHHEIIKKLVLNDEQRTELRSKNQSRNSFMDEDLFKNSPAMSRVLQIKN